MQQPLAIAVLGGLASSMGFSLFGVPILYRLLSPLSMRALIVEDEDR
jgi:multidrug efflux pump subunit AcrB